MKKSKAILLIFSIAFSTFVVFSPKAKAQGAPVQLTTNPYKDREPAWSPDGTKIAYIAFDGSWYRHIWVMNSDGSGKTQLTSGNIVDGAPAYSPNGTKIAFIRHGFRGDYNDLMLMDADGTNVQRLTFAGIPGLAEGTYNWPQWSSDGSTLLFGYGEGTTGVPWENKPFWICTMKTDGTNLTVLGRGVNARFVFDNTKILFNTDHYQGADMKIAIMNADGTNIQYLTSGPADHSPDMALFSHRIVFTRAPAFEQLGDLYVMDADGSNRVSMLSDGKNSEALCSHDEKYIAYTSEKSGNLDIWKMETPPAHTCIFFDDFERIALDPWFQVNGYASYDGDTWQGTGTVAIENGELSIITDSYWYNIYGVCTFDTADANFELSVSVRIMTDSAPSTNFGIGVGEIAGEVDENKMKQSDHIEFGYNGYYNEWIISGPPDGSPIERVSGASVNIGDWTKLTIKKLGDSYEFYVNDQLVRSILGPSFSQVNYVYLCNGVGVHWEGGTHVHYDNVLLCTRIQVSLPWKDDFDYETKQKMSDAGWRLDNEEMLSLGGGTLIIDNDGSIAGSAYYLNHFPDNVHDFKVEDKVMWIGRSYGGPRVLVKTQSHSYIWEADAYYQEYVFSRDGVKVLRFGEYTPQLNVWQIFSLKKIGNTFYLYQDGELKNTYVEPDGSLDALVGVAVISHWLGTLKYDYISVAVPSAPELYVPWLAYDPFATEMPFATIDEAHSYIVNAIGMGQPSEADFGTASFELDVTNTGDSEAIDVKVDVRVELGTQTYSDMDFDRPAGEEYLVELTSLPTESYTLEPIFVGDISSGETRTISVDVPIRFASIHIKRNFPLAVLWDPPVHTMVAGWIHLEVSAANADPREQSRILNGFDFRFMTGVPVSVVLQSVFKALEHMVAHAFIMHLVSPAHLHVYDMSGNHVGFNPDGSVDYDIPNVFFKMIEPGRELVMILNPTEEYTLRVEGTHVGVFDLGIMNFDDGIIRTYEDIPETEMFSAEVGLSTVAPDYTMRIDNDGDGIFEETREPSTPAPPPAVGGKATPINKVTIKPELQTPWIWLSTILLALAVTTVFYVKKRKRNTEIIS